jgi:anti-anti-sigma factor
MIDPSTPLIQYDLTDNPSTVVVEFISHKIADPDHAHLLEHQLRMLMRPDLPSSFILDFAGVSNVTSTAFGALVSFIRDVRAHDGRVVICNMTDHVRFGADILHLPDFAQFVTTRHMALDAISAPEISWSDTSSTA